MKISSASFGPPPIDPTVSGKDVPSKQKDQQDQTPKPKEGVFAEAIEAAAQTGATPEQQEAISTMPTHTQLNLLLQMGYNALLLKKPEVTREAAVNEYTQTQKREETKQPKSNIDTNA
jgi:hypothetical protein